MQPCGRRSRWHDKIPVDQLKFWVLGLALPSRPVEFLPSPYENDKSGINGFRQSGWEIHFPLATEVNGRLLPAKIEGSSEDLERVVLALPCMREPTVSGLHGSSGYAVRAAVNRNELPRLVPELKARGATDIVVSRCEQIVQ